MGTWLSPGFNGSAAFHSKNLSQFVKPFSADRCAGCGHSSCYKPGSVSIPARES